MFESDDYIETANETFTRTFYFPEPLVTTKIRLDNIKSSHTMAIRIELLGINRETKQNIEAPFKGGTVIGSKGCVLKYRSDLMLTRISLGRPNKHFNNNKMDGSRQSLFI